MSDVLNPTGIAAPSASVTANQVAVWRGLWWSEWLAHGRLITGLMVLWLIGLFVLELFFHPGFMLGFGVLYALIVGTASGGAEAFAGSEEFTFALPATRSERFLARLALGGGVLVAAQSLGIAAIALDLPQILWGLVADSGFTEPFAKVHAGFVYWLAAAGPFAAFAAIFAVAANANGGGGMAALAWLVGLLIAAAVMGLGFIGEAMLWGGVNGYVSCPALFALTPLALLVGHRAYVRKEGISGPGSAAGGSRWWLWLLVAAILVVFLLGFFVFGSRVEYSQAQAQQMEEMELQKAQEQRREQERRNANPDRDTTPPSVPAPAQGASP